MKSSTNIRYNEYSERRQGVQETKTWGVQHLR